MSYSYGPAPGYHHRERDRDYSYSSGRYDYPYYRRPRSISPPPPPRVKTPASAPAPAPEPASKEAAKSAQPPEWWSQTWRTSNHAGKVTWAYLCAVEWKKHYETIRAALWAVEWKKHSVFVGKHSATAGVWLWKMTCLLCGYLATLSTSSASSSEPKVEKKKEEKKPEVVVEKKEEPKVITIDSSSIGNRDYHVNDFLETPDYVPIYDRHDRRYVYSDDRYHADDRYYPADRQYLDGHYVDRHYPGLVYGMTGAGSNKKAPSESSASLKSRDDNRHRNNDKLPPKLRTSESSKTTTSKASKSSKHSSSKRDRHTSDRHRMEDKKEDKKKSKDKDKDKEKGKSEKRKSRLGWLA